MRRRGCDDQISKFGMIVKFQVRFLKSSFTSTTTCTSCIPEPHDLVFGFFFCLFASSSVLTTRNGMQ